MLYLRSVRQPQKSCVIVVSLVAIVREFREKRSLSFFFPDPNAFESVRPFLVNKTSAGRKYLKNKNNFNWFLPNF